MKRTYFALLIIISLATDSFSYNFKIEGRITDVNYGLPVRDHQVYFYFNEKGFSASTVTDKNGYYSADFEIENGTSQLLIVGTYGTCGDEIWDLIFDNAQSFSGTAVVNFKICYSTTPVGCKSEFTAEADGNAGATFISTSKDSLKVHFWSFGDGTYSFSDKAYHKYSVSGPYEVCLTIKRIDECEDTHCETVTVKKLQNIFGNIYAGDTTINTGNVLLYKENKGTFTDKDKTSVSYVGNYKFNDIESGDYLLYAIPRFDIDELYFPKYIPSYTGGVYKWQDAVIKKDDRQNTEIDINLISYQTPFYGDCKVKGVLNIPQDIKPDREIPIILLNSEKVPMDFRIPNRTGEYEFANLPYGVYFLHPEKAGLASGLIKVVLSEKKCDVQASSFNLSDEEISVGVQEIEVQSNIISFRVNPNPASENIYLNLPKGQYEFLKIFDTSGKEIDILSSNTYDTGNYLNISELKKGQYIIQVQKDNKFFTGTFIKF